MMAVAIKTPPEIEKMRVAGRLAAEVLEMIAPRVEVGITTGELDKICHDYITVTQNAIPAPLNYPASSRCFGTSAWISGTASGMSPNVQSERQKTSQS